MASKRNNSTDPYDAQSEGEFPSDFGGEAGTDGGEAALAREAETEAERLRLELQQQQEQIQKLFRLVNKQKQRGRFDDGSSGPRPEDTPEEKRFKKRTLVLKRAYPNTRV